jgi:hypothetical protein
MYYYLISSLKRRLVLELQDAFARHPVYQKIVPFIENKYAFDERPQYGIVIKGSNANKVQLSAENFVGTIASHVMLAYVGQPAYILEWVKEDVGAIDANNDAMPTPPGIYYMECLTAPTTPDEKGTFVLDPLLTASDELVLQFISGIEREAQLPTIPVNGTLRLWENRRTLLAEGRDYTVDYDTGAIRFVSRFAPNAVVTADYRYAAPSIGPIEFQWNTPDFTTLKGVVMAFGKRARPGDKVAIVVYADRVDTANAFGGRFEASFDVDVIARDPIQMEEIADFSVMSLWGEKRAVLSSEGIEIIDISIGGESEETYDETGDLYFYTASLSVQLQADWEIHVPLPLTISKVTPVSREAENTIGPDQRTDATSNLHMMGPDSSVFFSTYPILVGRNHLFERIT